MAKMYPEKFPDYIYREGERSGEKRTYDSLINLPEDFIVFYSCKWQGIDRVHTPKEGESDFIIIHPNKGVLVLEVKGGGIGYDADSDTWTSTDRNGNMHQIKDPIQQGEVTKHLIIDAVKNASSNNEDWLKIWNSVCFPDVIIPSNFDFGASLNREQVLDRDDLLNITNSVNRLFEILGNKPCNERPVKLATKIIKNMFARSFNIPNPLSFQLDDEDKKIIELTDNQFRLFYSVFANRNRVAIAGCAGSGKTMLGLLRAQQLSNQGQSVLFLCYNKHLAEFLTPHLEGGKVSTFHGLCEEAAKNMGIRIDHSVTNEQLFYETYPNILIDYATKYNMKYDTIIVDEAQDFQDSYWLAISYLLRKDSNLYIFYDDNQNIFNGDTSFQGLITEKPFPLPENCRNTRLIHNTVKKFHINPNEMMSRAPEGREPKWNNYSTTSELIIRLKNELNKLINENHVKPEDVVILTPKAKDKSLLKEGLRLGNFVLTWNSCVKGIQVSTIQSFKGLEKLVVLIAELDRMSSDIEKLLYVGTSRARTELICFYSDELESFTIRKGL